LDRRREVVPPDAPPAHEIGLRDEDPPVVAGPAARAAREAVEALGIDDGDRRRLVHADRIALLCPALLGPEVSVCCGAK
jgi:hypothetical protein